MQVVLVARVDFGPFSGDSMWVLTEPSGVQGLLLNAKKTNVENKDAAPVARSFVYVMDYSFSTRSTVSIYQLLFFCVWRRLRLKTSNGSSDIPTSDRSQIRT